LSSELGRHEETDLHKQQQRLYRVLLAKNDGFQLEI
jgi:hypothetical protein